MAEYTTNRRLYQGAGKFIERGSDYDASHSEAAPLLASGAISKKKAAAKSEEEAKPAGKGRAKA